MDQEEFFISPLVNHLTMNDIARRLDVSLAVVRKALEKNRIHPVRRHGVVRLWGVDAVEEVRRAIRLLPGQPTSDP